MCIYIYTYYVCMLWWLTPRYQQTSPSNIIPRGPCLKKNSAHFGRGDLRHWWHSQSHWSLPGQGTAHRAWWKFKELHPWCIMMYLKMFYQMVGNLPENWAMFFSSLEPPKCHGWSCFFTENGTERCFWSTKKSSTFFNQPNKRSDQGGSRGIKGVG